MTESRRFYVYVLFRENGWPFYVGMGCGRRWLDHERSIRRGVPDGNRRKNAIISNMLAAGWADIPKIKVAEHLTHAEAVAYEIAWISAIGRFPNGPLVNLTDGGDGTPGVDPSAETREKLSQAGRGRPKSSEHRANISAANSNPSIALRALRSHNGTGRKHSPETLAKMAANHWTAETHPTSAARIGIANSKRIVSPETRAKMRQSHLGKKRITRAKGTL